jgi:NADH-quinone oxidoreductase subunit G
VWAGPEVAASPALAFLTARTRVELSPADAKRLEVYDGDKVVVGADGATVGAVVALRAAVPEGSVFLEGNAVDGPLVEIRKATSVTAAPVAHVATPPLEPDEGPEIPPDRFPSAEPLA